MRVVVTGGGSGGHIFPALAVASALGEIDPGGEQLFIGGTSGMECEIVPRTSVRFQTIAARKVRRLLSPSTIGAAAALLRGYREARGLLRAFGAEAVIGTGGYVAAAATLAGAKLGLRTAILAPDLVPGRTNLMLSRRVARVCVVFEESVKRFPAGKTVVTGLPLRNGIVAAPAVSQSAARLSFAGLEPNRFTLLVIGGSQGARAINRLMVEASQQLIGAGMQIIHQVGTQNVAEVHEALGGGGNSDGYFTAGFLDPAQVANAYRAADLIVCRGGISTLSEALANGLPAAIIPLPTAYADHQTANARALEEAGAGLLWREVSLTAEHMASRIIELRGDPSRLQQIGDASRKMGRPNAAKDVAGLILGLTSRSE